MSKQAAQKPKSNLSSDLLAGKAKEALRHEKFKDAIEYLKQLIKQDDRPEWRALLADAYIGRAKGLAAKGMFKEAEIVLGNATGADGTLKEPLLLLQCLIRQGQFQKACACALKHLSQFEAGADSNIAGLTAALFLAFPSKLELAAATDPPSRAKWIEAAHAALGALNGWTGSSSEAEVDALLAKISLRSPFKALRLIIKSLFLSASDPAKARRLLDGVAADSPFAPMRLAVEAALPAEPRETVRKWSLASAAQQSFAMEIHALPAESAKTLTRLLEAERAGPAALFTFLLRKTPKLPMTETQDACLNLLPRIPDRIAQYEKAFGPLPEWQKQRILAIAAEDGAQWRRAETHWSATAAQFEHEGTEHARLFAGVIYRHLAGLASKHEGIAGENYLSDPQVFYLKKALACDPDDLPASLKLMDLLSDGDDKDKKEWHAHVDAAARRFPEESAVLLRAIDAAASRKAFKKAASFAQKLLVLDPVNQPARQRMIDLQIAQARKHMRGERADLAAKELDAAAQWERISQPNAALHINQGLIGLCRNQEPRAEAQLREGVELAGGGAAGWFRAALEEALLMPASRPHLPILQKELDGVLKLAPERQEIISIVTAMGASEIKSAAKAAAEVTWKFCNWLRKATGIHFSTAEFHPLAELLLRTQRFDILGEFAIALKKREPDEPVWRFYQIVARTRNNPDLMSHADSMELLAICDKAKAQNDLRWYDRIQRYFESAGDDPAAKRRAKRRAAQEMELDETEMSAMCDAIFKLISPQDIHRLIKLHGKNGASAALVEKLAASSAGHTLPRPALAGIADMMIQLILGHDASPF